MSATLVVFDLGGVLLRIRHTWDDVLNDLGEPPLARSIPWRQADYKPLSDYQNGSLSEADYLNQVGKDLNLDESRSRAAHAAILGSDYPGARQLILDLRAAGVKTALLSNTNELHWQTLADAQAFPAMANLDRRFASFEIRVNKPEPGAFEAVAQAFPEATRRIFFDDLQANVEGARSLGWEAYRVDPDGDPPAQMRAILVDLGVL